MISGSLRQRSITAAVLRTAAVVAAPAVTTVLDGGPGALPHFDPDHDVAPLAPAVDAFRRRIHDADALLLATPEYAGALPGSFKNLLDWTIGDDQPRSIDTKPVAWINPSTRGAARAHDELRRVLGYAGADIVEAACIDIPLTGSTIGADGLIHDGEVRQRLAACVTELCRHVSLSSTAFRGER